MSTPALSHLWPEFHSALIHWH